MKEDDDCDCCNRRLRYCVGGSKKAKTWCAGEFLKCGNEGIIGTEGTGGGLFSCMPKILQ